MNQINWFDKAADDGASVAGGTADWGTGTRGAKAPAKVTP
jgi:nitrate reductase / nitrite oxidoreductase, alpha subunit